MDHAKKMKAVRITEHGGPEVLHWVDTPRPQAGEGEVLVKVRASAINARDNLVRSGQFQPMKPLPLILGEEAAGTVETDTTQFRLGEPVIVHDASLGVLRDGAWAEFIAVPMASVRPMPKELTFEQAAGLASAGVTAVGGTAHSEGQERPLAPGAGSDRGCRVGGRADRQALKGSRSSPRSVRRRKPSASRIWAQITS